jgi:hypothetical protein
MEQKIPTIVLSLGLLLSGCATGNSLSTWLFGEPERPESYYTDPNSPGYTENRYGGLCEKCGRAFFFSAATWDRTVTVTCPYDGHEQGIQHAHNRYVYEATRVQEAQQQAQAQQGRAMAMQFLQMQGAQNQARQNCINNCQAMSVANQGGGVLTAYGSYPACAAACQ